MTIYGVAGLVFAFGALGGFVNCLLAGAPRYLPGYDAQRHWQPGWTGNIILGAVASTVTWAIYGASASYDLVGGEVFAPHLTLAQLFTSLVVRIGGSRVLTLETQKIILHTQRNAEEKAKDIVIRAAKELTEAKKDN